MELQMLGFKFIIIVVVVLFAWFVCSFVCL